MLRIWKAYRHAQAAWLLLRIPPCCPGAPTPSTSPIPTHPLPTHASSQPANAFQTVPAISPKYQQSDGFRTQDASQGSLQLDPDPPAPSLGPGARADATNAAIQDAEPSIHSDSSAEDIRMPAAKCARLEQREVPGEASTGRMLSHAQPERQSLPSNQSSAVMSIEQHPLQLCLVLHVPRKAAVEVWPARPGPRLLRMPCSPDIDLIPTCPAFGSSFAQARSSQSRAHAQLPRAPDLDASTCEAVGLVQHGAENSGIPEHGSRGHVHREQDLSPHHTDMGQPQRGLEDVSAAGDQVGLNGSTGIRAAQLMADMNPRTAETAGAVQPSLIAVHRQSALVTDLATEIRCMLAQQA